MVKFEDLKSGKVKLEFGNMDHINAIDEKAEADLLGDPEVLKRYRCTFYCSGSVEVEVEAFDPEEAEEAARDQADLDDIEWEDWEHHDIQLIGIADE